MYSDSWTTWRLGVPTLHATENLSVTYLWLCIHSRCNQSCICGSCSTVVFTIEKNPHVGGCTTVQTHVVQESTAFPSPVYNLGSQLEICDLLQSPFHNVQITFEWWRWEKISKQHLSLFPSNTSLISTCFVTWLVIINLILCLILVIWILVHLYFYSPIMKRPLYHTIQITIYILTSKYSFQNTFT